MPLACRELRKQRQTMAPKLAQIRKVAKKMRRDVEIRRLVANFYVKGYWILGRWRFLTNIANFEPAPKQAARAKPAVEDNIFRLYRCVLGFYISPHNATELFPSRSLYIYEFFFGWGLEPRGGWSLRLSISGSGSGRFTSGKRHWRKIMCAHED